jgi:cobalt-precorrin 5A hydrolase
MNIESKIAFISVTQNGMNLAVNIKNLLGEGDIYITEKLSSKTSKERFKVIDGKLSDFTAKLFKNYEILIFIMATGIVVRSIASHIKSKFEDPAI